MADKPDPHQIVEADQVPDKVIHSAKDKYHHHDYGVHRHKTDPGVNIALWGICAK